MALDGLSNQSVGIYVNDNQNKKMDELARKTHKLSQRELQEVDESSLIEKVDPDGKEEKQKQGKDLLLKNTNQLIEQEDETQVLEITLTDEDEPVELKYNVKFNSQTKMIEMFDVENGKIIEQVHPDELVKIISKAKNVSGMFVDKEI